MRWLLRAVGVTTMPSAPVLQPDGRMAVWSSIVDDFTFLNMTAPELAVELADSFQKYQPDEFVQALRNIHEHGRAWKWAPTWKEAMKTIRDLHGAETARERYLQITEIDDNG